MNILNKLYIGLVLNLMLLSTVYAQNPCTLSPDAVIDCDTVSINPTVSLVLANGADCFEPINSDFNSINFDLIVDDFTAVSRIDFTFSFDPTQYDYVSSPAGGLTNKIIDDTNEAAGVLRFVWASDDGDGYCLDNGSLIGKLRFQSLGSCEFFQFNFDELISSATITYNLGGQDCEREINFVSQPYGTCLLCDGVIVSNAVDAKPTIVIDGPTTVDQGDLACYDFTMSDFNSVSSISFAMNYNPQVLEFASVTNGALMVEGAPFNSTNSGIGILSMVWFDQSGAGNCYDPDEVLFTVCFNVVGDLGEETTVTLIDFQTTVIEVGYSVNIAFPSCKAENLCLISPTIEIECASLFFNSSACSESAAGANDASMIITPCGGVEPYTICVPTLPEVTGVMEGDDVLFENLLGGTTYTVLLKDSGGSPTYSAMVTPGFAPPIMVDITTTDPSCAEASNGSIEITNITGGVPFQDGSYEISWSNGIFNTQSNTSLSNGEYSVTISDEEGCTIIEDVTIEKEPLDVDIQIISNPSCLMQGAQGDGELKITVSGGTPPYQFNCSGAPENDCFNITNAQPGMFDFVICDANNCQIRDTIELEADLGFDFNVVEFCNSCGGEGGAISVNVTDPNTDPSIFNFTSSVFDDLGNPISSGTIGGSADIINVPAPIPPGQSLPGGDYTIIVTDPSSGCSDRFEFTIDEFPAFTHDLIITQPGCDGESGKIEVTNVQGAIDDIEYIWSIPGETGPTVCDLSEGNYRLTVTDGRCKKDTIITIDPGGDADVEATCTPATCDGGGSDGTLSAILSGSTAGTLNCVWTALDGTPIGSGTDISNVSQGMYIVICEDPAGTCMVTDTCEVTNADAVVLALNTAIDPNCIDLDNGTIWVDAPTTNIPVLYNWEGPNGFMSSDSAQISGLLCGTYNLTVTDATGCESLFSHELNCPPPVTVEITVIEPVICDGPETGKAQAVASGGTNMSGNYSYLFSSGTTNTGPIGLGIMLEAGTQWVIACDAECCSDTLFFEVPDVQAFSLDDMETMTTDVSCSGESDGSALLVASGGDDPYEYVWTFDGFNGDSRNDLPAGEYEINIIDNDGCENLDTIIIGEPDELMVDIDANNTNDIGCSSLDSGAIGLDVSGGTAPYMFLWTNAVSTSDQASGLVEGEYCVTVTDARSCEAQICHTLAAGNPLIAIMDVPELAECFGGTSCISVQSVSGGTGNNYTFSVNLGLPIPIDSCLEVNAGMYTINVFDGSGPECAFETTVEVMQPDPVVVDLGDDPPAIELGDSLTTLTANITSNLPIIDISWNEPVECVDVDAAFCDEVIINPTVPTLYSVTVTDSNGCQGFDDVFVDISDVRNVYTANIMSLSSQSGNDQFRVVTGQGIEDIEEFLIYDRWGNKMFESQGLLEDGGSEAWDGRYNGQRVNPGVYVYYARVSFIDDRVIEYKGTVTVVR